MSTCRTSEIYFWIVLALCAGALLGGVLVWSIVDPPAPNCDYQATAGNWQPACVPGR